MTAAIGYLGVQGVKWPIKWVEITPERGFHFHAWHTIHPEDLRGEIEVYAHDGTLITRSWDVIDLPKNSVGDLDYTLYRDQSQEIERQTLKAQLRAHEAAVAPKPKRSWWGQR
jgi:hypothetical protein